jgi:hypothetical protein
MNVRPQNYEWPAFYDHVIDLTKYTFSWKAIANRFKATNTLIPRWMNMVRAMSSEGFGRIRHYTELRRRLDTDEPTKSFFAQTTNDVPVFYAEQVKKDLGPLWHWLPEGALLHDHNAYLKAEKFSIPARVEVPSLPRAEAVPA